MDFYGDFDFRSGWMGYLYIDSVYIINVLGEVFKSMFKICVCRCRGEGFWEKENNKRIYM